jgi:hypothetical protein
VLDQVDDLLLLGWRPPHHLSHGGSLPSKLFLSTRFLSDSSATSCLPAQSAGPWHPLELRAHLGHLAAVCLALGVSHQALLAGFEEVLAPPEGAALLAVR